VSGSSVTHWGHGPTSRKSGATDSFDAATASARLLHAMEERLQAADLFRKGVIPAEVVGQAALAATKKEFGTHALIVVEDESGVSLLPSVRAGGRGVGLRIGRQRRASRL
jgi:hypothetical protein